MSQQLVMPAVYTTNHPSAVASIAMVWVSWWRWLSDADLAPPQALSRFLMWLGCGRCMEDHVMPGKQWIAEACVVGLGTACGALVRWIAGAAGSGVLHAHPAAMTVVVNLVGSLCLGFVTGRAAEHKKHTVLFWHKGVLAGFTTYSGIHIASAGFVTSGILVFAHLVAGIGLAAVGFALGQRRLGQSKLGHRQLDQRKLGQGD